MNSLNRDMNQQNKTERWEMEKIKNIVHRIYMDEDLMSGAREIKQLLSDARREERERCLEAIKEIVMELRVMFPKECFTHKQEPCSCYDREKGNNDMIIRILEALTTAEERIKSLSLPDQEQLSSKENQDE